MNRTAEEPNAETRRFTAQEILESALENARGELNRSISKLAFAGVAGGITMGLTGLGVASIHAMVGKGDWRDLVAYLAYPVGFIAVIIGRAQLFTENTLYPVVLVLDERKHLLSLLRLWGVVFAANIVGSWIFSLLAVKSAALQPQIVSELVTLGVAPVAASWPHIFWSGVVGGWLIALVAWTVTASHWTIGQLTVIYMFTLIVGVGHFAHCIATSCEILSAVGFGSVPVSGYLRWLLPATLGNICGGVIIVSLLNYGQVRAS